VACLAADGRLLVFGLDELKLQPGGGKGLTLMDMDVKAPLISCVSFTQALRVSGGGRGGKPKEELLKNFALAEHVGKRARKGKPVAGIKATGLLAAD
jgi:topoisomerase IV subunit A